MQFLVILVVFFYMDMNNRREEEIRLESYIYVRGSAQLKKTTADIWMQCWTVSCTFKKWAWMFEAEAVLV